MKEATLLVRRDDVSTELYEEIKDNLTLKNPEYESAKRFSKWGKPKVSEFLKFYSEFVGVGLYIPRNYNILTKHKYINNTIKGLAMTNPMFHGILRDYQKEFFSSIDFSLDDMVFEMPCGHGKTSCAIYYSVKIAVKTSVIVPTKYLLNQWQERIKSFTGEDAFVIKDTASFIKFSINLFTSFNYFLITIDLYGNLINSKDEAVRKALAIFHSSIGLTILDEAHRMGASTYHPILCNIPSQRRLALTATFRRADGVEKILGYHFGKRYTLENQFPPAHFYALQTGVEIGKLVPKEKLDQDLADILITHEVDYHETPTYINFKGNQEDFQMLNKRKLLNLRSQRLISSDLVFAQLDNYVAEHPGRLKLLQTTINACMDEGRTILVLSKRKQVLKTLYKIYKDKYPSALVISETNKMKPEERNFMQTDCRIIFGIMQLAQEGLDIDRLDTLILLHPISDTEQAVGRILRYVKDKKCALAILLLDNCYSYFAIYRKSHRFVQINAELKGIITLKNLRTKL